MAGPLLPLPQSPRIKRLSLAVGSLSPRVYVYRHLVAFIESISGTFSVGPYPRRAYLSGRYPGYFSSRAGTPRRHSGRNIRSLFLLCFSRRDGGREETYEQRGQTRKGTRDERKSNGEERCARSTDWNPISTIQTRSLSPPPSRSEIAAEHQHCGRFDWGGILVGVLFVCARSHKSDAPRVT